MILKRGLIGSFRHVGEQRLQRYVNEFDVLWNIRVKLGLTDTTRTAVTLKNIGGKRLMYSRAS